MQTNWGPCKSCKWWQIEPDARVADETLGFCIDEKILAFLVRITGNGGCNRWTQGEPARAKGSSDAPPSAQPTR
jgi:hypothetical protein